MCAFAARASSACTSAARDTAVSPPRRLYLFALCCVHPFDAVRAPFRAVWVWVWV